MRTAFYVLQDVRLLPNIQIRNCTFTAHSTFYWSLLSVLSTEFMLRWGSGFELRWHRVRIRAVPSAILTFYFVCLKPPKVKAGVVPGTGHDRSLAMLYKSSSTSHYTKRKIYSVWTQQFTYHMKSTTCFGQYTAIIWLTTKPKSKYSQLWGFGISQLTGVLLYKNTWQWYAALELMQGIYKIVV